MDSSRPSSPAPSLKRARDPVRDAALKLLYVLGQDTYCALCRSRLLNGGQHRPDCPVEALSRSFDAPPEAEAEERIVLNSTKDHCIMGAPKCDCGGGMRTLSHLYCDGCGQHKCGECQRDVDADGYCDPCAKRAAEEMAEIGLGFLSKLSPEGDEWRPIETAPKDGTAVLGYFGQTAGDEPPDMAITYCVAGVWFGTEIPGVEYDEPTHWLPLPAAPSAQVEREEETK